MSTERSFTGADIATLRNAGWHQDEDDCYSFENAAGWHADVTIYRSDVAADVYAADSHGARTMYLEVPTVADLAAALKALTPTA